MERFYLHTDRLNSLRTGQLLALEYNATELAAFDNNRARHMAKMFPQGISRHGYAYLYADNNPRNMRDKSGIIEALAEWIRRADYPYRPSRLQSIFAWRTLDDAMRFGRQSTIMSKEGTPIESVIWEVESQGIEFESDMTLLTAGQCWVDAYYYLDCYWRQDYTDNPLIEVLLSLPVRVIRQVQ